MMPNEYQKEALRKYDLAGDGPFFTFRCNEHQWTGLALGEILNHIVAQGADIVRIDRTHYPKEDVNPATNVYTIIAKRREVTG